MKNIFFIIISFIATLSFAQNEALFEQGKEAYKNGSYQESIDAWLKILEKGEHSEAVYFNLGNAYYKQNSIGPSIYYYEKALQLAPNDPEIHNNLQFAQNARIDIIEPLPQTIFSKWYGNVSGILSYNGWAVASVLCSAFFVLLFLLYYFSTSEKRKRLLFAFSFAAIGLLLCSLTLAFMTYTDFKKERPAIIFAESVEVKSEPSVGSENVFIVHEGTKVQIEGADEDWVRIKLTDGKDGWMPVSDLKKL